ncbi:MAG: hypothetical protein JW712_11155 [Dehalococcoidales bacterium]|nr:hypothetical protein [Dehalococcoidales bacterium]
MTESKYSNLITPNIVRDSIYPPYLGMIYYALKDTNFQIRFTHVNQPYSMSEEPHVHDFDEVFTFVPCTEDLKAYDAESEIYIGEEGEKIIIDQTCTVHIPAGLVHCPIVHKRVGTPFFFVNCPIVPGEEYTAYVDGKKVDYPVPKDILPEWER